MAENISKHVARLNRYLPFSAAHEQIFEEFQKSDDSLNLETVALQYTLKAIRNNARLIILTGDAGHGKTHLCRRLIQDLHGKTEEDARNLINTSCDGSKVIRQSDDAHNECALRIFKDFSELAIDTAARLLEEAFQEQDVTTIICANEGRLRAILNSDKRGDACISILASFNQSFFDGLAARDQSVHLINLNFQSVAANTETPSLIDRTLREWTSGTRWSACRDCAARPLCPLSHNRMLLSGQSQDGHAGSRRAKVELLFATLERLGIVVTIRDMLMSVAYLLTSGLRCEQVHARIRRQREGWQSQFSYYNLLFELPENISDEQLRRIPVLREIQRLDPGKIAIRAIDEQIINDQKLFPSGEIDLKFPNFLGVKGEIIDAANGVDDILGNPRNRKERTRESAEILRVVRALRRRAFFDDADLTTESMIQRLGFNGGGQFLSIIAGDLSAANSARLKRKFLAGLHAIQGLQLGPSEAELFLVDPAFGNATSHAAIVADTIGAKYIQLMPLSAKWKLSDEQKEWAISRTVDWIDRHIVLRISDENGEGHDLPLDLMTFDSIVRAAGGYVAEQFYIHDIRRITNFLGQLAETRKSSDDRITLFLRGKRHSASLDDGLIQVGGGDS